MADKIVVVFDFDRTIIDGDSDNWVVSQMGLTSLFHQLYPTMPWNSLMNKMMEILHSQGRSVEDIGDCLKQMPLHPCIISAIKSVYSMGCDLRIVSDANKYFIETILRQHYLLGCFTEITTNPTLIDEGRLKIIPYLDCKLSPPHGCTLCPSNMCKGMILERLQASTEEIGKKIFIYIGDGGGDYCPSLKLEEDDHVMPRMNFPLWKHIQSNPSLIKAKVHEWSNGKQLAEILLHLINKISDNVSKDDSVWADSDEEADGVSDLDREWNKRREQFYNVGYRDGISAGQNDAAQDGFNSGFKDSVMAGYKWGIIRGVTSALANIPDDVKVKLIESEEIRGEFMNLHATVDSIGTEDALKFFYEGLQKVKSDDKCKSVESSSSLTHPSGSKISDLVNHFGKLELLLKESPMIDVYLNFNQNSAP